MKAKHIQFLAILGLICTLAFSGCQKDDLLSVDTNEILLSTNVEEATFNIRAEGSWSITSTASYPITEPTFYKNWFELSSYGGGSSGIANFSVTVSLVNDAIPTEDKSGALVVKNGKKEILIPVKFKK